MPNASSVVIHPLAVVSMDAELAEGVIIGPYCVIQGKVRVGSGCVLQSHVVLCGPLTLGRENRIGGGTVLGEQPQDLKYKGEPTALEIGDGNVFHERVAIHRGSTAARLTRIGSRNVFRARSHVGHDCQVGNGCTLAERALVGGHCTLDDGVHLGRSCAVHQFRRIGRLARLDPSSITTKDIPPFARQRGVNTVRGLNLSGLRRAGMSTEEIENLRVAFRILFRTRLSMKAAVQEIERELGVDGAVGELIAFLNACTGGINGIREHCSTVAV
jgi:UDP-N-acetylglucosamine acyltransferase